MHKGIRSLSALTLFVAAAIAGTTVYAQTGNEIELRGVRSQVAILAITPVLVAIADPTHKDYVVLVDERRSQPDGSIYTEALLEVFDEYGTARTLLAECSIVVGPGGMEYASDLRMGRESVEANLMLPVYIDDVVDVFVGRSDRVAFSVLADEQLLGRVELTRVDVDQDGLDDGVNLVFTGQATQAVYEKYYDWSLYQDEVHPKGA